MLFRLNDIQKSYGGTEILKGVSFQINRDDKVGLVGRNGAGKTTAFRIITGQEGADEGEVIKMNGLKLGLLEQHVEFGEAETVHTAALSAFKEIHDMEAEMRRLEKDMETDHSDSILNKYADLQTAFEQADGFSYAAKTEAILLGMGFLADTWLHDVRTLSGGQKNRLGMVRMLLSNADVLLLDEPTNHLDVDAVEWLEEFLKTYDKAYVVISHDRYFLDRTTNRVIELDRGMAVSYSGNYSKYLVERELRREQQQREYENQQAMINKTQEFIRRNLEGQKTKQAKSRRNMLERMDRIEAVQSEKSGGNFRLKKIERAGNNVLTTEDVAIGYGDKILASGINISLHRGGILGVIGGNGTGKTTLLKTLLGTIRELEGRITWGTKTNIGYYSQTLDDLYEKNDVINELRRVAPMVENGELRSFLARFLFFGEDIEKKVSSLSGGEKGRLALAKLIYSQKNVLILDEPTNHLDIPAREALESALDEFPGTVVTVSHDRFFLDRLATQMLSFEVDGSILDYDGNYTQFHEWKLKQSEQRSNGSSWTASASETTNKEPQETPTAVNVSVEASPINTKPRNQFSKNQRSQIERRIAEIEMIIPQLEKDVAEVTVEISRADIASDYGKLNEKTANLTSLQTRVQSLYTEWESLAERLS
jgi:ATP-binding cassette, subfamily F, member 3